MFPGHISFSAYNLLPQTRINSTRMPTRNRRGSRGRRPRAPQTGTQTGAQNGITILGADLQDPTGLAKVINDVNQHEMTRDCKKDYHGQIKRIINFWKENSPAYYEVGVRHVPDAEYHDPSKYYFPDDKGSI